MQQIDSRDTHAKFIGYQNLLKWQTYLGSRIYFSWFLDLLEHGEVSAQDNGSTTLQA